MLDMRPYGYYCRRMDTLQGSQRAAASLRAVAAEQMISIREIARLTGLKYTTLRRKMKGEREFTITEVALVCRALDVDLGEAVAGALDSRAAA